MEYPESSKGTTICCIVEESISLVITIRSLLRIIESGCIE